MNYAHCTLAQTSPVVVCVCVCFCVPLGAHFIISSIKFYKICMLVCSGSEQKVLNVRRLLLVDDHKLCGVIGEIPAYVLTLRGALQKKKKNGKIPKS